MQIVEELMPIFRKIKMELASRRIKTEKEYYKSHEIQKEQQDSYKRVFSTEQPFERVSSEPCTTVFCGNTLKCKKYEESVDFWRRVCARGFF